MSNIPVFLVDDDTGFLEMFKNIDIAGADVHVFRDPQEAIEKHSKIKPRIVISDVQMPGINGVAFLVIATEFMKLDHFIVVSGNSKEEVEKLGSIGDTPFFKNRSKMTFMTT